ncbi:MAG: hypothetical protein ABIJ41_01960 [Candidatus Omnitrophota bacterium]
MAKLPKKIIYFFSGFVFLICGIAFILGYWPYVVVLFKGVIGICLAFLGLVVLFFIKE